MTTFRRYDLAHDKANKRGWMKPSDSGQYVAWIDVENLLAEIDHRLVKVNAIVQKMVERK